MAIERAMLISVFIFAYPVLIIFFIIACLEPGSDRGFVGIIHVPTLVPKPGSSTVTQEHLRIRESDALRALGLSRVMMNRKICSLKIRVSMVRFRPWP